MVAYMHHGQILLTLFAFSDSQFTVIALALHSIMELGAYGESMHMEGFKPSPRRYQATKATGMKLPWTLKGNTLGGVGTNNDMLELMMIGETGSNGNSNRKQGGLQEEVR